jgi:hypothetical protein
MSESKIKTGLHRHLSLEQALGKWVQPSVKTYLRTARPSLHFYQTR